ncbi:MAG: amidase [Gemmatimonadetes bacterium]|nr:amidase [Gemmatimonadota bacterium]
MNRRNFVAGVSGSVLGARVLVGTTSNLGMPSAESSVAELQAGMQSGAYTAREVTEMYLARIESIDRRGPAVNSVIEVNPEAIGIAESLDQERRAGRVRGPLHGITILIKDNIDTADRMQTTAGSLALEGSIAPKDAGIVDRLRAAGCVLIGKTNLSEWANFRSSNSSSGWSGRGGQTKNPYVLDRTPCGSSAGSGAAGAAALATITIGTETDGSIVCPSSINGLVGIKPTVGLWSRAGIIPISHTQDTAGPMCRSVADAAALLGPLTGVDPRDPATTASRGHSETDYRRFLDPAGLRGARIGVMRKHMNISAKTEAVYDAAIAAIKAAGATIVDSVDLADPGPLGAAEWQVLAYEFKAGVEAYLGSLGSTAKHRTLADLIAFNLANRTREMPHFAQETFDLAAKMGPLSSPKYRTLLATCRRLARTEGLDRRFNQHRLDALISVTSGPAWPIDLVNGDRFTGGSSTYAAVAGYPNITVPMGQIGGLPVGLSFVGRAWSEGRLIQLAYGFEETTKARMVPTFRTTIG